VRKSTIKKIIRILASILVTVCAFPLAIFVITSHFEVQTMAARMAASYLSRELKTDVRIGLFNFSLTRGLVMEDILFRDQRKADMFSAKKLAVQISSLNTGKKILIVRKVYIEKGVFQLLTHKGDSVLNLARIIDHFSSHDTTPPPPSTPSKGGKWHLLVNSVELDDTRFHFQDMNKPLADTGMDYSNIDVSHINLEIVHFVPDGDTMKAQIRHLSAVERSGFTVNALSGEFQVGPRFLKAKNLKVITKTCHLDLDFAFHYDSWEGYSDFLNKVRIQASIRPSEFCLEDIGAFAPVLYPMKTKFHISGDVNGSVSNFRAKNFRVAFGKSSRFFGNITANGLPNVEETFVDMNIRELVTTKEDIEAFRLPEGAGAIALPQLLANAGKFDLSGVFTGFYNDFSANASLVTDIGSLRTDLNLKKPKGGLPMSYSGNLDVSGFHVGGLLGSRQLLGRISLRADLQGQGVTLNDASVTMNVHVDTLEFNRYSYHGIQVKGIFEEKTFDGTLFVADPNLGLSFRGLVDLHDSLPTFDFRAKISHAQLHTLHLFDRDSVMGLAVNMNVRCTGTNLDNLEGSVGLDSLRYFEGEKRLKINSFLIKSDLDDSGQKKFKLLSDVADADFTGKFKFVDLIPSLSVFVENYLASFRLDTLVKRHPSSEQQVHFTVRLKKTEELTAIFVPFLKISPSSVISGDYNEGEGIFRVSGRSPDIDLFGSHLSNWFVDAKTQTNVLDLKTGCRNFLMEKPENKDTSDIRADSLQLGLILREDTIHYDLGWTTLPHQSHLGGFVSFLNDPKIEIRLTRFDVFLDHRYWNIARDNFCIIDTSNILIHNLSLSSGEQFLKADGIISDRHEDTLNLAFNKLNISDLDLLLHSKSLDIDGILNGRAAISGVMKNMTVMGNISIGDLFFNKEHLGDAEVQVGYNTSDNRFDVLSRIIYTGNVGKNIPLELSGSIYLGKKVPALDLTLALKNLNLNMVGPFVSSFMSGIHGRLSGNAKISGTTEKPVITGKLDLMRTEFKINYLNVPYSLSDAVTLDTNEIRFNNVAIFDSLGHKAYLNGAIRHHYFKDIRLDLGIDAEDFSVFRNSFAQNPVFYGNARSSGTIKITGPIDHIFVSAKAQTGGGTHVIIPISTTADVSENNYIIFIQKEKDTLNVLREKKERESSGSFAMDMNIKVNPEADVEVFFPSQLGNIKASGSGNLTLGLTPAGNFYLSGGYLIHKGTFLFQLKNLLRLSFSIKDGSSIRWTGDATDANVAVSAVYKTRVPLQGVVSDPELAATRVQVECIIRLSGKLFNPDISFALNMPNVEDDIKTKVYSAIDTNNTSEMNQQMIYLLVLNQFKPVAGAGGNMDLSGAPLSIVTNQLNSMLSQLTHNVNVGVNYQKATSTTNEEFDVGVSTTLFNDRLLIDGTFGMSSNKNTTTQQASNIVGDVNIEYLLTKDRRLRVRAFNRTNTVDALNNNAPYTQGVGISYQREFNRLSELFQKKKKTTK
jgi:hypothetical protein